MSRLSILGSAIILSLALGVSFVTSTAVASRAYVKRGEQQAHQARALEVTGSARLRIRSDLALWSVRVMGEGKTLEEAFSRLSPCVEGVRGFLSQRGFPAEAVSLGPILTAVHYKKDDKGRETREVLAYEMARRFDVKSHDVARVEKSAGEVTELVQKGLHVETWAPEFLYTKLAEIKLKMIGEATANARERAQRVTAGSGCKVGAVRDVKTGVFQITRPWSTEASAGGVYDTSTVEKDITSVVHLTVMIETE